MNYGDAAGANYEGKAILIFVHLVKDKMEGGAVGLIFVEESRRSSSLARN